MLEKSYLNRYIIISPVKDEENYIEATIESILAQTTRPHRWVVVDDASHDGTSQILSRYAERHDWITVLRLSHEGGRKPGSAVIGAFLAGYELIKNDHFDFVVKLDCDLKIPPDYFENLLTRFNEDPELGIASGVYAEERQGLWNTVTMPEYHVAGCSKFLRAKCFDEIGGFIPQPGWDTVDEVRAQAKGWKTRHFKNLTMLHLKPEGVGIGFVRTNMMHGEIYYITGGGTLFFCFKLLHRFVFGKPIALGSAVMLAGFARAWFKRKPKLVNEAEARLYRDLLNRRISAGFAGTLSRLRLGRKDLGYS
jgi:biofilm PGA synthesis N-glycosyltransferase PgaC